jgi:hypothetical protein
MSGNAKKIYFFHSTFIFINQIGKTLFLFSFSDQEGKNQYFLIFFGIALFILVKNVDL